MKYGIGVLSILFFLASAFAVQDRYVFKNQEQQKQFSELTQQLRCLVCQNENLEASNAPLANDIKAKIYQMILNGQSNEQILAYLTQRYGDFIDFKPPVVPRTYLLWFGPFVLLFIGFWIVYRIIRAREP